MASYNGAEFIKQQLESILNQLNEGDEIIIVDDCSTDSTVKTIKSFEDKRINVFRNEVNKGHVYSFGRAISLATKDLIFMSDQDDIWIDGRVDLIRNKLLNSDAMLISSNSNFINSQGDRIDFKITGVESKSSQKYMKNIFDIFAGKENYYGCSMAFKKEMQKLILPIPNYVESHDLWIAMAANIAKSNLHCDEVTFERRVHGNNASIVKRKLILKIWSRIIFVQSLVQLTCRKILIKN
ncbi:glycosyltransferase [Flavobacterium sp. WC2509]|uniref:glycosyltransferase n=1 Tax=Flavobacterium sp. WC2509 TaxID=3461406 RepID=UPI004043A52B